MRLGPSFQNLSTGVLGLLAGFGLATVLPSFANTPRASTAYPLTDPPYRGLDGTLYMQTAAEYRACCYQSYYWASRRVKERLEEVKNPKPNQPFAVVLDLDETVLDNSGFQAMLLRSRLNFDLRLWKRWEQNDFDKVALIPGAGEFLAELNELKITPVFISNRSEECRDQNKNLLKRLGIGILDDKQLKLSSKTSDKTARRQEAESQFTVLLNVGDQLRDFDEMFLFNVDNSKPASRSDDPAKLTAAIAQRNQRVDANRNRWGRDWIVLPNSSYGEWTKPFGRGLKDLDLLVPE